MAVRGVGFNQEVLVQTQPEAMNGTRQWVTYLCANCGYFENYLTDKDKIAQIVADPTKATWRKLSP
jgi:hypothetical protein